MKLSLKLLALPVLALLAYLVLRILNQSLMLSFFPIDGSSQDYCSHIANLFFLKEYGFHAAVPNWYNGHYVLFKYYPFLWHFFSYPVMAITNNPVLSTFTSLLFMYAIGLTIIWKFGSIIKISRIARVAFFAFFFANPVAIGTFLKLGKLPEMFGWLWFIALACLVYYYRERDADWPFALSLILMMAGLFYSHTLIFIVAAVFIAGFLFYKLLRKELRFVLISMACGLVAALLASPLLLNLLGASNPEKYFLSPSFNPLTWLVSGGAASLNDKLFSIFAPLAFLILFVIYYCISGRKKDDLLFYSFPLAFAVLYLTRLPAYLPIINRAAPDMYGLLFLFYALVILFTADFSRLPKIANILLVGLVVFGPVAGVALSATITPWYSKHSETAKDTLGLLDSVDGPFMVVGPPANKVRDACVYSYGAIYHNTRTPLGWSPIGITKEQATLTKNVVSAVNATNPADCSRLQAAAGKASVTNIILYGNNCRAFGNCFNGLQESAAGACLIKLPA